MGQIGEGSFGKVFKCRKQNDPKTYALKIIDTVNPPMLESIEEEVRAMKTVKSPYTMSVVDNFYDN
jgi:serine/threonine protein kinase